MDPVSRKEEGIYSRELFIVIARNEAAKQSPVLILRLKSLLQIFFATHHTSANPPHFLADGGLEFGIFNLDTDRETV
jgi:hypothetical protein